MGYGTDDASIRGFTSPDVFSSWPSLRPHSVLGETLLCQNILVSCHKSPDTSDFQSHIIGIRLTFLNCIKSVSGIILGVRGVWGSYGEAGILEGSLNYSEYRWFNLIKSKVVRRPDTRLSITYYYWFSSHISELYKIRVRDNPGSEEGVSRDFNGIFKLPII